MIYFNNITFNNSPVLWDYNEKTNKAVCTFVTKDQITIEDKAAFLAELKEKKLDGIVITDDMATINDFITFSESHPSVIFSSKLRVNIPTLNVKSRDFVNPDDIGPSIGRRSTSSEHNPSSIVSPRKGEGGTKVGGFESKIKGDTFTLTSSSKEKEPLVGSKSDELKSSTKFSISFFEPPKAVSYESIKLPDLITRAEVPSIWGDTAACKKYFSGKTKKDRSSRVEICLKTESSFTKDNQYLFNDILYPRKGEIYVTLEKLFEQELHPAYVSWKKELEHQLEPLILAKLFKYFRHAVLHVMLNENFNKELTEYEKLSEYDRTVKFGGNDKLYHYANYKLRIERAELMMMDLVILIDEFKPFELSSVQSLGVEESSVELPVKDREAVKVLESFKTHLMSVPERVKNIKGFFARLQGLLIQLGEVERDNKILTSNLSLQFKSKPAVVGDFFSLYHVVKEFLVEANNTFKGKHSEKYATTSEVCEQMAETITTKVIYLIVDDIYKEVKTKGLDKPHISIFSHLPLAKPTRLDKDIYLSDDWKDAVKSFMAHAKWDDVIKQYKGSKENEIEAISIKIYEIIKKKAEVLQWQISTQSQSVSISSDKDAVVTTTTTLGM